MAERAGIKKVLQHALDNDGRTLEAGIAAAATSLNSAHPLQLALDEVASFRETGGVGFGRIEPQKNRRALEKSMLAARQAGGPPTYPVLYLKDAERVPGNRRVVTGEIVAALKPGVNAEEIAHQYKLSALPAESSMVGLAKFVARSGFEAMEVLSKLRLDARIAMADHDLIKMIAPKAIRPNDPLFADQWALLPEVPLPPGDLWHINVLPALAPPVWGDFAIPTDGIRGRGVRVGIVDDGLQLGHPDFAGGLAPNFDHHSYDLVAQIPTSANLNPAPQIRYTNGPPAIEPLKLVNQAHGVLMAGLIGARANNSIGIAGTAPECQMVGIRALSYFYDHVNQVPPQPPSIVYSRPVPSDRDGISPMQDVLLAAAFSYLQNDSYARIFPGKTIFANTPYQSILPSFPDVAQAAPMIQVKSCGWGAPESGNLEGPGPELAGYTQNYVYFPGARSTAVTEGRKGLGTVFIHPAGNGRYFNLDNANNDGYANAREVISVGALARIAGQYFDNPLSDHTAIYSEFGSCVTVCAPGGGSFFGVKANRINNGQPQGLGTGIRTLANVVVTIPTTDWSINEPADPNANPPVPDAVFGRNQGGTPTNDYTSGAYTRQFAGTSAASGYVSGVVALMLEANPRLSWIDVQNILMRTARNHLDPLAYALNPAADPGVLNPLDGLDIRDTADVVQIDRDWKKNGAHVWFNHKYGAGLVDARRALDSALVGVLLPPQSEHRRVDAFTSTLFKVAQPAVGAAAGISGTVLEISLTPLVPPDFAITHVRLRFDKIQSTYLGDLRITLLSPSGMDSVLLEPRIDGTDDLIGWEFGSLRHWGENGTGTWRIQVADYFEIDEAIINPAPGANEPIPRVTLSLFGYIKPLLPDVTRPLSIDPAAPTIVEVPRGKNFSYSMNALNNPTVWFVQHPDPLATGPVLPPGLALTAVPAEATSTYLPTRVIQGTTNEPLGSTFDVEVIAANVTGFSVPKYVQFVVVPPTGTDPYTQWADFHFPPFALGNPAANGSADAESDGGLNMAEFALGTSPVASDFSTATTFLKDASDHWNFRFKRFLTRGFVYELQVSSTLATGSWTSVAKSDPAVNGGVPTSLNAAYTVTEGATVPAGPEPQSEHRLVTVVNDPTTPPPLYYRVKLTPPRFPFNPQ